MKNEKAILEITDALNSYASSEFRAGNSVDFSEVAKIAYNVACRVLRDEAFARGDQNDNN